MIRHVVIYINESKITVSTTEQKKKLFNNTKIWLYILFHHNIYSAVFFLWGLIVWPLTLATTPWMPSFIQFDLLNGNHIFSVLKLTNHERNVNIMNTSGHSWTCQFLYLHCYTWITYFRWKLSPICVSA